MEELRAWDGGGREWGMFIEGGDEVERNLKKCVSRGPAAEDELSSNKCNFGIAPACLLSSRSLFGL